MMKKVVNVSRQEINIDTYTIKPQEGVIVDYNEVSDRFKEKAYTYNNMGIVRIFEAAEVAETRPVNIVETEPQIVEPEPVKTKTTTKSKSKKNTKKESEE